MFIHTLTPSARQHQKTEGGQHVRAWELGLKASVAEWARRTQLTMQQGSFELIKGLCNTDRISCSSNFSGSGS